MRHPRTTLRDVLAILLVVPLVLLGFLRRWLRERRQMGAGKPPDVS
ncbi:MAG: hypothetical protein LAN37_12115 [Acidobacteriia bacterium]|nr:hypothetical protein [Terriglobia bacterium]